jgi:phosphoglycerol transferase MdoB-like AlkP superfamily enzyme
MTTSNHRPYTYPDGKISIPSGQGREGAVAYTDFAIGEFIEKVKSHAWFDNTIFIIVADHCAGSARKSELDVSQYRIPAIVYAPGLITKGWENKLCSQIDLLPTILGKMGWTYSGTWFGQDVEKMNQENGRAYVGNYQKLGHVTLETLVILGPKQEKHTYSWDASDGSLKPKVDEGAVGSAIATYQGTDRILEPYKTL